MMLLVRLIDLLVRAVRYLGTPEARFLRAGLVVVVIGGALIGAAGLFWLLAQLPTLFAGAPALQL
ncbi:hypothetical protein BHQ15_14870 [Mycolicibacillus koreensis]|nr:hypothetical protein BHQ15_14870 [Mycolicibacillus koreensis]